MGGFSGAWRNRAMGGAANTTPLGAADPSRHMREFDPSAHGIDDTAASRMGVTTPVAEDFPAAEWYDSTDVAAGYALGPVTDPQYPVRLWPAREDVGDGGLSQSGQAGRLAVGHGGVGHALDESHWAEKPEAGQSMPTVVHEQDEGLPRWLKYHRPIMESADQRSTTPRFTPNENTSNSDPKREREAWAKPVNNPADTVQRTAGDPHAAESGRVGWASQTRYGYRVQRWNERKIPWTHHSWQHAVRGYAFHTAKTAGDSPPLAEGSQYTTPFAALANTRFGNFLHPMVRREPQSWDESAVTDGTETGTVLEESVSQYNSWGL